MVEKIGSGPASKISGSGLCSISAVPDPFQFAFSVEQKQNQGEDAEPILSVSFLRDQGNVAVFDGMGGAGSAVYTNNGVTRTGAYIAARLASEVVRSFFANPTGEPYFTNVGFEPTAQILVRRLEEAFKAEVSRLEAAPSRLGGKMIRQLPTTMAGLTYKIRDDATGAAQYSVYWAGDSRAYCLSPINGLEQLTKDDIKSEGDALQNLLDDSPISNCINADSPFTIHVRNDICPLPVIFLVATDGCFNFNPTPAHLEYVLLDALMDSASSTEWCSSVRHRLHVVAGDDLSMALVALGWSDFAHLKADHIRRHDSVRETFIRPIDDIDAHLIELTTQQQATVAKRNHLRTELWEQYRKTYERFRCAEWDANRP